MSINEFDLIQHFFNRKKVNRQDVILGIGDDAALLQVPADQHLVATVDTLVAGQHFLETTSPEDIGHKALAVALSDLAAMGAKPAWVLLALTIPTADEIWLEPFARGFFSLIDSFGLQLIGGDVTRGPLSITVQAMGFVSPGKALRRSGAQPGDGIYVTGTLGDAGLALAYLQNPALLSLKEEQRHAILLRLNRPEPRINIGLALIGIASSAIDISDGLASDLGHILSASQVGATIQATALPLSKALKELPPREAWSLALSAGDDYELCFTVPKARRVQLQHCLQSIVCPYSYIGDIEKGTGLSVVHEDELFFTIAKTGFQHFY